jgi:hypothetical protein
MDALPEYLWSLPVEEQAPLQINSYELSFLDIFLSHRLIHNWWHVAVCYLELESSLYNVLEIYDHNMKQLEGSDWEEIEGIIISNSGYFTLV